MIKVEMSLTDQDAFNAEYILNKTCSKNKAEAVSIALDIGEVIVNALINGKEVIIRDKFSPQEQKLIVRGLKRLK